MLLRLTILELETKELMLILLLIILYASLIIAKNILLVYIVNRWIDG